MTTTLTDGLFQRAIIESGAGRNGLSRVYIHDKSPGGRPSAESIGVAFAKANGIEGDDPDALVKLRALPADAVVSGLNLATMMQADVTYSGSMIDGIILRADAGTP
jgi:para-nitrobenzyl esterase